MRADLGEKSRRVALFFAFACASSFQQVIDHALAVVADEVAVGPVAIEHAQRHHVAHAGQVLLDHVVILVNLPTHLVRQLTCPRLDANFIDDLVGITFQFAPSISLLSILISNFLLQELLLMLLELNELVQFAS